MSIKLYARRGILTLGEGDKKLSGIPSFDMPPGLTCSAAACRTCYREGCYAAAVAAIHKQSRAAWAANYDTVCADVPGFIDAMKAFFASVRAPRFFRVHSSGDFFSVEYAAAWREIIASATGTKFLIFTKQFDVLRAVDFSALENCRAYLSHWTGCNPPADLMTRYPVAWLADSVPVLEKLLVANDRRGAVECPGNCGTCGAGCWMNAGKDVVFLKHGRHASKENKDYIKSRHTGKEVKE